MKKKKFIFYVITSIILVLILFFSVILGARLEIIKYSMKACLVTFDGTITDNFDMELYGTIQKEGTATYLDLEVALPDSFPYIFMEAKPHGNVCNKQWGNYSGDYATVGYTNTKGDVGSTWSAWAINTEKQYFIAWFGEGFGQYLVASTDPNVKPEKILEHFSLFLDSVAKQKYDP